MFITQTQGKPRLNRHIKANKTHIKTQNQKKSEELKLETLPQHQNSLELDFNRSPWSIQS